jgi:hypothetical protein
MAVGLLDIVIFVPLMRPDEIKTPIEEPALRRAVNARLRDLLDDDPLELLSSGKPRVLEVSGARDRRLGAVVAELASR